ncbi:MAG: thrombospondin type 3 repeat-containing protein [Candidatus Electrothrix scaldis]|nr:MAG: thrombospondin type 3 repeat-containing protein [Candidatus Electrothrix sp. GW3-3]
MKKRLWLYVAIVGILFYAGGMAHAENMQKLLADDSTDKDMFGQLVAISGNTALIAKGSNVYVFDHAAEDGSWHQRGTLFDSDFRSIKSLALDGDTALIAGSDPTVFVRAEDGTWTEDTSFMMNWWSSDCRYAYSVSLSGNTALVGDHSTGFDEHDGKACVFIRAEDGTWSQQATLTAEGSYDFGYSVAVSGDTALIGSEYDGNVYVFVRAGNGEWSQQAKLVSLDNNLLFGRALSLYGDTALIGAAPDLIWDGNGSAYIFSRGEDGTWSQQAKLVLPHTGFFGASVSLRDDVALIGAPGQYDYDDPEALLTGSAYIFRRLANSWQSQGKIIASDGAAGDWFGTSVSLGDSGTVLIGAKLDDDKGTDSGAAYIADGDDNDGDGIFDYADNCLTAANPDQKDTDKDNIGNACDEDDDNDELLDINDNCPLSANADQADEDADGKGDVCDVDWLAVDPDSARKILSKNNNEYFPLVSVDGENTVVVYNWIYDFPSMLYLFKKIGQDWVLQRIIPIPWESDYVTVTSVAVDGDSVAVSALYRDGQYEYEYPHSSGDAYIYNLSLGTWDKLNVVDADADDMFGSSLSLNGDTVAVGVPGPWDGDNSRKFGAVYIFTRSGDTWIQQQRIIAPDGAVGDRFGASISIDGNTVAIAAPEEEGGGLSQSYYHGSVYVFTRSGTVWELQQKIPEYSAFFGNYNDDSFGSSVSLSGDTLVIGSYDQAAAYVYIYSGTRWEYQQRLVPPDGARWNFDDAILLHHNTLAIGAAGSFYIFTRSCSSSAWILQRKLEPNEDWEDIIISSVDFDNQSLVVGVGRYYGVHASSYAYNLIPASCFYGDSDGDGILDEQDNCPTYPNAEQEDLDSDGTGDFCDSCDDRLGFGYCNGDIDGDRVSDDQDNCLAIANRDQQDMDSDGIGDACDYDDDGDGAADDTDNCLGISNPDQADSDNDGIGDVCDEYIITPSAGTGGSISPGTPQVLAHGAAIGFTIMPLGGYAIEQVEGCGGSLVNNTYTIAPASADCTVAAIFRELDSDEDGIDDAWEMQYFGNLTTADATTDYDRDGYTDLQEYLNNLNGETDPKEGAYDPTVRNAPRGTGWSMRGGALPAVYLLLLQKG